mgnify:CR=1 FL=1
MVDYKKMTVKEIKQDLESRGVDLSKTNSLKKEELVRLHMSVLQDELEQVLETIDMENDFVAEDEPFEAGSEHEDPDKPSITSPEWHDYVMQFFQPNELVEGNPITAGLRRVAELLLGDIMESGPINVVAPSNDDGPGRATVTYRVTFNWMNSGQMRTYADTADVWHGNTDDLFCAHPVATASTRAEGRALRKALKIRALAAEELSKKDIVSIVKQTTAPKTTDGDWNPEDRISSQQIGFIDNKCKQLDISVSGFINSGKSSYSRIDSITKNTASEMIRQLNKYQNGDTSVPEEISGYDPEWRKQ